MFRLFSSRNEKATITFMYIYVCVIHYHYQKNSPLASILQNNYEIVKIEKVIIFVFNPYKIKTRNSSWMSGFSILNL